VEKLQLPTSFHPNQTRIKFGTGKRVKEVLCDITPTNSCHLLLRWAWLHFNIVSLDERSLYLRHEGHEVEIYDTKTGQEGSTSVEGENRKRKNRKRRIINCRR